MAAASWARFQRVTVVGFGVSVGAIAVLVGCAAQERNPATTTAATGSSGEALDASSSISVEGPTSSNLGTPAWITR